MMHGSGRNGRGYGIAIFVGLGVGLVCFSLLARTAAALKPEDAGLGRQTRPVHAEVDGIRISGFFRHNGTLHDSFDTLRRDKRTIALWLGASQLYAINRLEPGDRLAVEVATGKARGRGSSLSYLQLSGPNANLNELLATYLGFRQRGQLPDWLILALTYDDLRESGVRRSVLRQLSAIDDTLIATGGAAVADLAARLDQPQERKAPLERNSTSGTPQERLEHSLVAGLESVYPGYSERGNLVAAAQLGIRSYVTSTLGGLVQRRAPAIPAKRRDWNMDALESLIALAQQDGVQLFIYKPPHRPGQASFYHDRDTYDRLFDEVRVSCERVGIVYADLEGIVPETYWGTTNEGRPDVFHFRAFGHEQLGLAVDDVLAHEGS